MWLEVGFAALLRVLLSKTAAKTWLDDRVEISTPVTAWKRVEEGLALQNLGLNPYAGDVVHEAPLLLKLYGIIFLYSDVFFILLDIASAILIKHAVDKIHEKMVQEEQSKECHDTFQSIKLTLQPKSGYYSMMVFLFNPYSIVLSVTKVFRERSLSEVANNTRDNNGSPEQYDGIVHVVERHYTWSFILLMRKYRVSHCLCITCDFGQKYVFMKSDRGSHFEKFTNAKLLGSHCIPHMSCRKLSGGHFGTRVFMKLRRYVLIIMGLHTTPSHLIRGFMINLMEPGHDPKSQVMQRQWDTLYNPRARPNVRGAPSQSRD
eukprot:sb/3466914/